MASTSSNSLTVDSESADYSAFDSIGIKEGFPSEIFVEQDKIVDFICAICTEVCRQAVETSYE